VKKLTRLWQTLESVPGLLAIPAFWEAESGDEFGLISPFLRPTDTLGTTHPCPLPGGGDCPRKIIDHGDGEIVAICRDPHKICPEVSLVAKEALLHELDLSAFLRPVLAAASIRMETPRPRCHGVWSIGLSNRRSTLNQPVFFLIFARREAFSSAVRDLLLEVQGPFLIASPTNRHRTVELQELLQARGVGFICLEEQVLVEEGRGFASIDPLESADMLPPTPVADRKRVIKAFRKKHGCKVVDIQREAGVHSSDYYKWLRGDIPDHYSTCIAIEKVLVGGLSKRARETVS
jgi:hypothetical protein